MLFIAPDMLLDVSGEQLPNNNIKRITFKPLKHNKLPLKLFLFYNSTKLIM